METPLLLPTLPAAPAPEAPAATGMRLDRGDRVAAGILIVGTVFHAVLR